MIQLNYHALIFLITPAITVRLIKPSDTSTYDQIIIYCIK